MASRSTVNLNDPFANLEEEARAEEAQQRVSAKPVTSVVANNDPFANLEEEARAEEAALAQPLAQPIVAQEESDPFSNLEEEAREEEAAEPLEESPVASPVASAASPEVSPVASVESPIASPIASVESPIASVESPIASVASPIASVESPIASVASPIASVESPVASVASPIASVESPMASVASPIASVASPIASVASPVASVASPVASVASPIASVASPDPIAVPIQSVPLKRTRPPIIPSTAEPSATVESSQKSTRPPVIQPSSQKSTRPPVIPPSPLPVNESENEDEEMDEGMNSLNSNTLRQLWNSTNDEKSRQVLRQAFLNRGESPPEEEMDEEEEVIPQEFKGMPDTDLLELWDNEVDPLERDRIVKEMQRRNLFPSDPSTFIQEWENATGAYPDIIDPKFLQKLLAKREFAESLQTTWEPATDPCTDDSTFEVTPVQRFVTNFMSPKTPYMSALLFHGVGVGKTCAAVQIMEAWLEFFPQQPVYLVAPQTIQNGFYRTIFDIKKVVIGKDNEPNTASQCTGTTYMKLTNTLFERDPIRIERRVMSAIRLRYKVFGYIAFANHIQSLFNGIPSTLDKAKQDELKKKYLRQHFSGRLLIVDEAHNLRDVTDEAGDDSAFPAGKTEKEDAANGKLLTPFLRDVLRFSEGMKFCALTATPMYNFYKEIIFMFNMLLMNDKKATITETEIFDKQGGITVEGSKRIAAIAQRYVSFMRGENPISFPIRLFPQVPSIAAYPTLNPRGNPIPDGERDYYRHLPLVPIPLQGDTLRASIQFMTELPSEGQGLSTTMLEKLVHAGNFIVPATDVTQGDRSDLYRARTDMGSLLTVMDREVSGGEVRYRAKESVGAGWLALDRLAEASPKFAFLLERTRNADGCVFAYTRFVNGGARELALALEANGYTAYGRKTSLLINGIQAPGGKQCARCIRKQKEHSGADHEFAPAYYGLLTGDTALSPQNDLTIRTQRDATNVLGTQIKILIGSQIASEGVDLRFVRETHVIDSWYHLNKTEQILGRAIRYLSHCLLPKEKRNNTVYLYTSTLPSSEFPRETVDQYSYRVGFNKAVLIGKVTRIMKQSALDCNLNRDAIIIHGQQPVRQIDAQRVVREQVNINDNPFTAVCDWIETCEYQCQPTIAVKASDDSTYDEYAARWRLHTIKQRLRDLFKVQPFYQSEDIWNLFSDIPQMATVQVLQEVVDHKQFQVQHGDIWGYIRYCNKYYLFQPNVYPDLTIPLAIRVAKFPVKRDEYTPIQYEDVKWEDDKKAESSIPSTVLWGAITTWIQQLSLHARYSLPSEEINQYLSDISQGHPALMEHVRQQFEMVQWFHTSFHESKGNAAESFRIALLLYFWDNMLSMDQQNDLIYSSMDVSECVRDSDYVFGSQIIHRHLDPVEGEIKYYCDDKKECARSVSDVIRRDANDPMKQFRINEQTMGFLYGFLAPKRGSLVFKTAAPPSQKGVLERGLECSVISTITIHKDHLIELGDLLRSLGKTDFDLNAGSLSHTREVRNSIRACTLMEIVLRFMDAERIQKKHWFVRPLQAFYAGHRGTFEKKAT